jgi:hypothetical protein
MSRSGKTSAAALETKRFDALEASRLSQPSTVSFHKVDPGPSCCCQVCPLTAPPVRLLLAGYDFTIYSQLSNTMTALFFPQTNPTAATLAFWTIYAVGYLARPVGAIVFGHVGESQSMPY